MFSLEFLNCGKRIHGLDIYKIQLPSGIYSYLHQQLDKECEETLGDFFCPFDIFIIQPYRYL
jgi:hypothetical protein